MIYNVSPASQVIVGAWELYKLLFINKVRYGSRSYPGGGGGGGGVQWSPSKKSAR